MKRRIQLSLAIFSALSLLTACGQVRHQDERVISINDTSNASEKVSASNALLTEEQIKKLVEFYQLYSGGEGFKKDDLMNLSNKLKAQLKGRSELEFAQSSDLHGWIEFLFKLDRNHDGKLTPVEIQETAESLNPTLNWKTESLSNDIKSQFPRCSISSQERIQKALITFDSPHLGGNGDHVLSDSELSMPGLMIGALQTDAAKDYLKAGIQAPSDATPMERLAVETLRTKLLQNIFLDHSNAVIEKEISDEDLYCEWTALSLELYQAKKSQIKVNPASTPFLARLYDSQLLGGNADQTLNSMEFFHLNSDFAFIQARQKQLQNDSRAIRKNADLALQMLELFPRTGASLFLDEKSQARAEIWNQSTSDLAQFYAEARIVESIFALYDRDGNHQLSQKKAQPIFEKMGIKEKEAIQLFFANVGLDGKSGKMGLMFKLFMSDDSGKSELSPSEFQTRLHQVIEKAL